SHISNTGNVSFADAGGGRADALVVNGSANSDVFTANGPAGTVQITDRSANIITDQLRTPGVSILQLQGLAGDVSCNVTGAIRWSLLLDGGDPSGSDTANLSGATGAVTVNLGSPSADMLTQITGYGSTVTLTGIETANLNANNNTVSTVGTALNDNIT